MCPTARAGAGSPLIQVHLVNTQTGGKEAPGGYPAAGLLGAAVHEATPARAEPAAAVAAVLPCAGRAGGRDFAMPAETTESAKTRS